jgi:ribosomal protein S1
MDAEEKNWQDVKERLRIGDQVEGRVMGKVPKGYFIDINAGFPTLLESDQMPVSATPGSEDSVPVGSAVKARIVGFDETPEKQIRLMQKP